MPPEKTTKSSKPDSSADKARETRTRPPEMPLGPRLEAVLEVAYRARRPVLLEGVTGIGKSEIVQRVAQKLGVASVVLDLSLLEPPDLLGLPRVEDGRTTYALPRFLPRDGEGILMLEELNRAERYIQQPALQLLTARKLHEYELPGGWACFAAINPEIGEYQVTPLDPALRARFLHLRVRADRGSWLAWAAQNGVHPVVLAVARSHDRVLDDVPPRTWTYVSQVLSALSVTERSDSTLLRDLLGGYLPPSWVELVLAQREGWEATLEVDTHKLLREYRAGCPEQSLLVRYRDTGATDRLDEVVHRLKAILQSPEAGVLLARGELSISSIEALLGDLPGDHREALQESIATNATLIPLIDVRVDEVLNAYAGSSAAKKVTAWLASPAKQYRVGLLATSIRTSLSSRPDLADIKRVNAVRVGLGHFLLQAGTRWGSALAETLARLGITPIRPGTP